MRDGRRGLGWELDAFQGQQPAFQGGSPAIPREAAVGADDPVAGDERGEWIGGDSPAGCAGRLGPAHSMGQPAVGARLAVRNVPDLCQRPLCEG